MGTDRAALSNYYFAPLGRQPGGYLDFLGLPPNASEAEARVALRARRRQSREEFVAERTTFRERKEAGEITEEQFKAAVAELETKKNDKLCKLNELTEELNRVLAELRIRARAGFTADNEAWLQIYIAFDENRERTWDLLLRHRPVGEVEPNVLEVLLDKWFKSDHSAPADSAGHPSHEDGPVDSRTFSSLLQERDLLILLYADALWGCLRYTNRAYWAEKVEQWSQQIKQARPQLQLKSSMRYGPGQFDAYRILGQPPDLTLGNLDEDDEEVVDEGPAHDKSQKMDSFEKLAAMLKGGEYNLDDKNSDLAALFKKKLMELRGAKRNDEADAT